MATTRHVDRQTATGADLQELAQAPPVDALHAMGGYADAEVPIIVRGEGCYVWDEHGNRYLDGLSALFCVNAGHGRAGARPTPPRRRSKELDFYTVWSYAHPRAIELAARIAELDARRPQPRLLHLGGSEAVESAIKLARDCTASTGNGQKIKFDRARDRLPRHHARRARGDRASRRSARRSSRCVPGGVPRAQHQQPTAGPRTATRSGPPTRSRRRSLRGPRDRRGGDPRAGPERRRLHPARRTATSSGVREICDRHDVLLISDEVICAWGRLGHWFGCQRYGYQPDIITTAKALTSAYAPMGFAGRLREGVRAVMQRRARCSPTARPSPATRSRRRSRWRTSRCSSARTCSGHVLEKEGEFRGDAREPPRHPDRRRRPRRRLLPRDRAGRDQETLESLDDAESEELLEASSPTSSTSAG